MALEIWCCFGYTLSLRQIVTNVAAKIAKFPLRAAARVINLDKSMKILLFGSGNAEATARIRQVLASIPEAVVVGDGAAEAAGGGDVSAPLPSSADMVFSIGGDGTFLRTAHRVGRSGIPILGVNAGRLGFLADVPLDEVAEALPPIVAGRYDVERRSLLRLDIPDCGMPYLRFALNEVAVMKRDVSSMISVTVRVNGVFLNQYDADGLVVATPTGSTAYAMSAGGPILEPQADCFVLVPIAPHALTARPFVIRDSGVVEMEVRSRNGRFLVSVDGTPLPLATSYSLRLRRADHTIAVVRRPESNFYNTLREKLMWGRDPRPDDPMRSVEGRL